MNNVLSLVQSLCDRNIPLELKDEIRRDPEYLESRCNRVDAVKLAQNERAKSEEIICLNQFD